VTLTPTEKFERWWANNADRLELGADRKAAFIEAYMAGFAGERIERVRDGQRSQGSSSAPVVMVSHMCPECYRPMMPGEPVVERSNEGYAHATCRLPDEPYRGLKYPEPTP
jgi:hypothetical protein